MRSPLRLLFVLCALALSAIPAFAQQKPPEQARTAAALRAFQLLADGQLKEARAELDRAASLGEGPCGECLLGQSHIYAAEKKWDQSVKAAQEAIPLLKSPGLQARAYNQLGMAVLNTSEGLARAEDALRHGAELGGPWGTMARYNLAEVLLRRGRWADAAETARRYLQEAGPEAPAIKEARIVLCRSRAHLPEPPPPAGDLKPAQVEGKVQPPQLIAQTKPSYTDEAREAHTTGTVVLESIIDTEGCVHSVKALQGLPNGLTKAAMEALRQWVFSPATLEGKPVMVYYALTINFQVDKNAPRQPEP
jgi:TonB family protein